MILTLALLLAAPAPKTGTLEIKTTPPGATVIIDAKPIGKTPLKKVLEENTYWITIQKDGFEDLPKTVELEAGATVSLDEKLKPLAGAPQANKNGCPTIFNAWDGNPDHPPDGVQWFRVPEGKSASFEVNFTNTEWEGAATTYLEGGQYRHVRTADGETRHSFHFPAGCYAVTGFHKEGHYAPSYPWLRSRESWSPSMPNGPGVFRFEFFDENTAGSIVILIK
jgi:hypothetical protein